MPTELQDLEKIAKTQFKKWEKVEGGYYCGICKKVAGRRTVIKLSKYDKEIHEARASAKASGTKFDIGTCVRYLHYKELEHKENVKKNKSLFTKAVRSDKGNQRNPQGEFNNAGKKVYRKIKQDRKPHKPHKQRSDKGVGKTDDSRKLLEEELDNHLETGA